MVGIVGALALALAACTPPPPAPAPSAAPTGSVTATPTTPPPAESAEPVLRPDLSASDNLAYFDSVNRAVIEADPDAGGRAFVDALVAAGFDKEAIQVTADTTTIGDRADSIQFAVVFPPDCLIGQYGPKSGGYQSAVRPMLEAGDCLVGATRPIDW